VLTGAQRAAVLGSPVAHSLSPALHRAAYASLGLTGWTYEARDVATVDDLARCVAEDWAGLSLTMPLKQLVQPMLVGLDAAATVTGSVNTVLPGEHGPTGANTDVAGVVTALAHHSVGEPMVLGGGATAASAVVALAALGADDVQVVVRAPARGAVVAGVGERAGIRVTLRGWDDVPRLAASATVVVSTVPFAASPFAAGRVRAAGGLTGVLLDVVYDPWPTPLAAAWTASGGTVVDGFEMLVGQAVEQVRLMTGRTPEPAVLRAAGRAERTSRAAQAGA
jgi:shikimate dehydrogenase